jgi:hypothetical protein
MNELEILRDFLHPAVYNAAFVLFTTLAIPDVDTTILSWAALSTRFCIEWHASGMTCVIAAPRGDEEPLKCTFIITRKCMKQRSPYTVIHLPTTTAFAAVFIQKEKLLALKEKTPLYL